MSRQQVIVYGQSIPYNKFVGELMNDMGDRKADIMHAAAGVSGEAGELLDAAKKHWVYNKPLDIDNVFEELGDIMFYVVAMCNIMHFDLESVLQGNASKLAKRYHEGKYTDAQAQARADKDGE